VRSKIASKLYVIINHWSQNLNFLARYALLERFHVEVVKMGKVKVQFRHLFKRLPKIVAFQIAMEDNVVTKLGKLNHRYLYIELEVGSIVNDSSAGTNFAILNVFGWYLIFRAHVDQQHESDGVRSN